MFTLLVVYLIDCIHRLMESALHIFFFSRRRRHTRYWRDWSSDVCSSDLHIDPEDQPRSQAARTRHGRAGDNAHQHPWPPLLPLRRRHAMLTHPTIDQLRALKLDGMADAFVDLQAQDRANDLDHAEWLALLLDREAANRNTKRFQSRLRSAKLRHGQASIEDVDYRTSRRLDKALFQQLAAGRWIVEHRNLLVTGPCGIGKSWLSCALAQKACRDGYTVHYARVPRLFADLELAHGDGRFARLFRTLTKVDLLILDDWGPDRFTASQRRDLMEIVEDRYGAGSTLITSQLPVDAWHPIMSQSTASESQADADRLEAAADEAIAVCGGDVRAVLKAMIVANEFLESEVSELMKAVSRAYVRGRFH